MKTLKQLIEMYEIAKTNIDENGLTIGYLKQMVEYHNEYSVYFQSQNDEQQSIFHNNKKRQFENKLAIERNKYNTERADIAFRLQTEPCHLPTEEMVESWNDEIIKLKTGMLLSTLQWGNIKILSMGIKSMEILIIKNSNGYPEHLVILNSRLGKILGVNVC